jgi:hypothetical protein
MRLGPPSTLLLVLALLLALAGPPGVAAGAQATAPDRAPVPDRPALQADTFDPNVTVIELEITADGDARWTVTHEFDLADANDTRAFERLAGEFERDEVGGSYLRTMERAAEAADEGADREMAIRNVSRDHVVENGTGRLVTRLTWTSFARVTGDTLRVDDAFELGTGTRLPALASDERPVVSPPPGYRIDTAPSADSFRNGSLVWEGPTTFESGHLSVTYRKVTPPASPRGGTNTTAPPSAPFDGEFLPIVAGVFGVGLLLLVAYLLLRRETPFDPVAEANGGIDSDAGSGPDSVEEGASATGTAGTAGTAGTETPSEPTGEAGSDGPEPTDGDEGGDTEEEPAVDPELLSDEERVERLLRQNGGRMKQANIVRETNWSNAKVSQLLSSMDEADRIDKLRIGRENLITLPDEDPGEFGE